MLRNFSCLLLFVFLMVVMVIGKLPSVIRPCHRNDPHLNECIIHEVYKLRPLLASGDLGDGYHTPPLEPLHLDTIKIAHGRQYYGVFTNIQATGCSNFIINNLSAHPEEFHHEIELTLPKIDFKGVYDLQFHLLLFTIKGKGDMNGSVEDAKAKVHMHGSRYDRNGVEYVKFDRMNMNITANKFYIHFDNLFNGDPMLSKIGNRIINDHQQVYMHEILPELEKSLSQEFLKTANKILETTTYKELFPL